jgi:ankyrin repeat protein
LMTAVLIGVHDVVSLLISKGADVNKIDANGRSPLMMAAIVGHVTCARLLIDQGADVNIKDIKGRTALMIADQNGYQQMKVLIGENSTNPEQSI